MMYVLLLALWTSAEAQSHKSKHASEVHPRPPGPARLNSHMPSLAKFLVLGSARRNQGPWPATTTTTTFLDCGSVHRAAGFKCPAGFALSPVADYLPCDPMTGCDFSLCCEGPPGPTTSMKKQRQKQRQNAPAK